MANCLIGILLSTTDIPRNDGYPMIYVDILEYFHEAFRGRLRRRLRAAPPRPQIDGCDGPCAVGHPVGCARVSKQTGEISMLIVSYRIQDLIVFSSSFDLPCNFVFAWNGSGKAARIDRQ